jgi:hypothetical protein
LCEYELAKQFLVVLIKCGTSEIDLTAYSCMKVRLAAQVLSDTVAFALCQLRGDFLYNLV